MAYFRHWCPPAIFLYNTVQEFMLFLFIRRPIFRDIYEELNSTQQFFFRTIDAPNVTSNSWQSQRASINDLPVKSISAARLLLWLKSLPFVHPTFHRTTILIRASSIGIPPISSGSSTNSQRTKTPTIHVFENPYFNKFHVTFQVHERNIQDYLEA